MNYGYFPFGQPNTERPARKADHPRAIVIGVYPSAFHVSWKAPGYIRDDDRRGRVSALAVDVEPTVFWDGSEPDGVTLLKAWLQQVGFQEGDDPGQHGHVSPRLPAGNGSSGREVLRHYLEPLGLTSEQVTFTDIYPIFMIKGDQEAAIRREFNAIAERLDFYTSQAFPAASVLSFCQLRRPRISATGCAKNLKKGCLSKSSHLGTKFGGR